MKKMMLVPSYTLPSPLMQKLSQLDEEMQKILLRTDLDESSTANAYSQVSDKYLKMKEKLHVPQQIKIVEDRNDAPSTSANGVRLDQREIVNMFPEQYRSRAENLLKHMNMSTDLSWSQRRELTKNEKQEQHQLDQTSLWHR